VQCLCAYNIHKAKHTVVLQGILNFMLQLNSEREFNLLCCHVQAIVKVQYIAWGDDSNSSEFSRRVGSMYMSL
jgi:hypothetical protein